MADDLRHFLAAASVTRKSPAITRPGKARGGRCHASCPARRRRPSDQQPVKIVPKGLRSFDADDADFFLELLPGPRDRDGLPDSIRFWKTRIEETDADNTFCGGPDLRAIGVRQVVAGEGRTAAEAGEVGDGGLCRGDRRRNRSPACSRACGGRCRTCRATWAWSSRWRRCGEGRFLKPGQKVLLVLDQFEQWLHAKRSEENTELVQALRQCDGGPGAVRRHGAG